jgi:hypothetical protein
MRSKCSNRVFSFCGYPSIGIGNKPSCEAIVASTDSGTCRVSPKKCPRQRSVQSWTANPQPVDRSTNCSTCSRSDAVSVKYLRTLVGVAIASYRRKGRGRTSVSVFQCSISTISPRCMLTRIRAALLSFARLVSLSHARPDYYRFGAKGTKARLVFSQNVVE